MAGKNIRNMKVCGMSGYKYKAVPTITLKGQWLNAWGFGIDDPVMVKCEDGKLVIEKVFDKTEMVSKGLERAQGVAEETNNYGKKGRKIKQEGSAYGENFGMWII